METFRWNSALIFRIFSPQEARNILKTPIRITGRPDCYFWSHSNKGQYTVRSAYEALTREDRQSKTQVSRKGETSWAGEVIKSGNSYGKLG